MHLLLTVFTVIVFALLAGALFTRYIAGKVNQAFRPAEWMEVEGERIQYRSLGQGPAIVMVHGLAGQSRNFDYLPLEQLAKRWRIVLLDRPGSGLSPRRDDGKAGVSAQGRLLAGFVRGLGLRQPPLLVGHSLGGAIALSAALQDPDAIAGLALIAPLTHFTPHVPAPFRALAMRPRWLRRLFGHTLAVPLSILASRRTLAQVFAPEPAPEDFGVRGGGVLGLRPSAFEAASADLAGVEQDLPPQQQRYPAVRVPVRVLFGDADALLDWRAQGEALRSVLPQADLRLVPGAGHMLPVTQAAATTEWLEQSAQAALARFGQHAA
jgi:pimeloyl-ACP methyl ester carboxylesterase